MSNLPRRRSQKWYLSIWEHPLTLLLIGSALSCLLVPWISENSSRRRVLQEQRVSEARDILKQSVADDAQINAIVTSIEMFNKEAASNPKGYKAAQAEHERSFDTQYLEFDHHAWWWGHDLPVQSGLLELPSGSKDEIENLNQAYAKSLLGSTQQIEVLRKQFLGKDYVPRGLHNAEVLLAARKALNDLAVTRGAIISQLAGKFMPPGINW